MEMPQVKRKTFVSRIHKIDTRILTSFARMYNFEQFFGLHLGSGGEIRAGSNPVEGTKISVQESQVIRFAWDEENEGSNPSTETILGSSQVVRHWILAPAFIGSNPIFPAKFIKILRDRGMVTSLGS